MAVNPGWTMDMGARPTSAGVRFRVWAPAASHVDVELPETGQLVPMQRDEEDVWSALLPQAGPGSRYFYRLDGQLSRPDPYSRSQPDGPHGASAVVDPDAFEWHDDSWAGHGIKELVIYQLHVGAATAGGTFDSLIERLPALRALGINAVEPLPIVEFPGRRNWGYDGVDLFAPASVYGGPDALKRCIDAAHQNGLAVLLDVVYNHLGPDGNYLRDFAQEYFNERHHTPWGAAINYDGPRARWVRQLVLDNARYWIQEFHADGLRLDAVHAIYDDSPRHVLAELTETVHASLPVGRSVALIAESSENDVRYLRPVDEGGFGLDAVWADDFHHSVRRYLAGDHEGYYADYAGTLEELARTIEQGWLYEGQGTPRSGFEQKRGTPARDRPAWQFVYTLQNHDQVGNRAFGERLHHQVDVDRYRAASTLLLFLPYTPLLFMGQEFSASSPFLYFTDHTPELGRLVTEGRRKEFAAFAHFADPRTRDQIPDPQAEATFLASKLPLAQAYEPSSQSMLALYEHLLELRRTDEVLRDQARDRLQARALAADVLSVRRWRGPQERLLLVNFGDSRYRTEVFGGGWRVILDSRSPTLPEPDAVTVAPRSATVLARESA